MHKTNPDTEVQAEETAEQKLDRIAMYLHRMDRRDRMRTIGGFVHGLLALIPMLFFLWSAWYVYEHGDELLQKIAGEAARQAAGATMNIDEGGMQQLLDQMMGRGQQEPLQVR